MFQQQQPGLGLPKQKTLPKDYYGPGFDLNKYYGPLSDVLIEHYCETHNMITPFNKELTRNVDGNRVLSHGVSSYGYDVRSISEFRVFMPRYKLDEIDVIDPKSFDPSVCEVIKGDTIIIPPNGFILTATMEEFNIPPDITVQVLGKSTYARCSLSCLATPLEAGWAD